MEKATGFEVSLTDLVYGGDAFGRLPDGRAVFVPFALPGENVQVEIVEERPRHVKARIAEIISPSPSRIEPRCRHFGVCGGCHYQHMPYDLQTAAKTNILADELKRIGKLPEVPVEPIVASVEQWYYRNYIQFHLAPDGSLGYSKSHSHEIVPITECFLPQPPLDELWQLLKFEPETLIERVGLRLGDEQDILITLESKYGSIPELVVEELNASVVHLAENSNVVLVGNEFTWMHVLGRRFRLSARSFFQVNAKVAEKMVEFVLGELPGNKDMTILEVYSGAGLFSVFLAERATKLVAVESSSSACEDFAVNLDEFDNVDLYEAPAEVALPALEIKPEVVLVDPPRNGLLRPVLQGILKMTPAWILYVSCDPATLGRDARYLRDGGYELCKIRPFDMFPQTYHIESISVWKLPEV